MAMWSKVTPYKNSDLKLINKRILNEIQVNRAFIFFNLQNQADVQTETVSKP